MLITGFNTKGGDELTTPMDIDYIDEEGAWLEGESCKNCPDSVEAIRVHGTLLTLIRCDCFSSTHYNHILSDDHYPCHARRETLKEEWDNSGLVPNSKG